MKKVLTVGFLAMNFLGIGTLKVNADTYADYVDHPHPHYLDEWRHGLRPSRYAYSEYYLKANVRVGSKASVTDIWGNVKSEDRQNYGWAKAGEFKKDWWLRADCFWDCYPF